MGCTLLNSVESTLNFTPMQRVVHSFAYDIDGDRVTDAASDDVDNRLVMNYVNKKSNKPHVIQLLQYFALPLDNLIQAVASPIFTIACHIKAKKSVLDSFKKDPVTQRRSKRSCVKGVAKIISYTITGSLKLMPAALVSGGFIINGVISLVLPIHTIYQVYKGREGANRYYRVASYFQEKVADPNKQNIGISVLPKIQNLYIDDQSISEEKLKKIREKDYVIQAIGITTVLSLAAIVASPLTLPVCAIGYSIIKVAE